MPEEILESPQPTQPTEPKSFDWPKIILAVLLGLGLLAGAAYVGYYYGTQQAQQIEKPSPVSKPTPTPTPSVTDLTANWKTYTNEIYGYEFKYPPAINPKDVAEGMPIGFRLANMNVDISFWTLSLTVPAEEFISREFNGLPRTDQNIGPIIGGTQEIIVDSTKSFRLEGTVDGTPIIRVVIPLGKDKFGNDTHLDIRGWHTDETDTNMNTLRADFDQILSTFKFLD